MPSYSTLAKLAGLSEDQWGLVTLRQALHAGISRRTLDRLTAEASVLERVATGVYRLAGAPRPDHLELRAAWFQLAPEVPGWERTAEQGVVSHRSATSVYGIGDLPADRHDFTSAVRKQTRRPDVRLHIRPLLEDECINLRGLPVTRPGRIAADLLRDKEEPDAVARIVTDAIRERYDHPGRLADSLAPFAAHFGLRRGDGISLLRWFLDLTGDPEKDRHMQEARVHHTFGQQSDLSAVR